MNLHSQRKMTRILTKATVLLSAAAMLGLPFSSTARAGKEGVFISSSVYFTLDDVTLASGTDKGSLRFTLELNNESGQIVDFNHYGVKITDELGASYPAQISLKKEARVKPNQKQEFSFISQVPLDVKADQLKVELFQWDAGSSTYMRDLGALSVANALANDPSMEQQVVFNMKDADSSLPGDSLAAVKLGSSYRVYKNGSWIVYSDIWIENKGSAGFKLPAGLQFAMTDSNGYQYPAQTIAGADSTLLPKQAVKVKLQAAIPGTLNNEGLALAFSCKAQSETKSLGSISLSSSIRTAKLGEEAEYPTTAAAGIKISNSWTSVNKQSDGLHIQSNVTLSNQGGDVLSIPSLSAEFQAVKGGLTVSSTDNATRSAYLSPGETTVFRYSGVLPAGLNADDVQLVIFEKSGASTTAQSGTQANGNQATSQQSTQSALPVFVGELAGAVSSSSSNDFTNAKDYILGAPLAFNSNNQLDSNLEVSLVELHMHQNDDFGYNTAIAKYKLTNKGSAAVAMPALQTELASAKGYTFTGSRQTAAAQQILPNTSYVLSYSYLIPSSEEGDQLAMKFYDANRTDIGSFKVALQNETGQGVISFYPFQVNLKDYRLTSTYSNSTYAYKLWVDLDISRQEEVIVDANFSKLTFEAVDRLGRTLSSVTAPFVGTGKLATGTQTITLGNIKSDQTETGIAINIYEQIETPNGPANRLVKVINP